MRTATIAHALAVIRNELFGGSVNAGRVVVLALFHDAAEAFTGDVVGPIKHFNEQTRRAFTTLETEASRRLLHALPRQLQPTYGQLFGHEEDDLGPLVAAADKLCAYMQSLEELRARNAEFDDVERDLREAVAAIVQYFLKTFCAPIWRAGTAELSSEHR